MTLRRNSTYVGRQFTAGVKIAVKFLMAFAIIALAGLRAEAKTEPQLRTTAAAQGEMITLGDLFAGAGADASTPFIASPRPGKSIYVDTAQIVTVLRSQGLQWRLPRGVTRVLVSRESSRIPAQSVIQAIEDELRRREAGSDFEIEINARKTELFVPLHGDTTVVIEGLDRDVESGSFMARVYLPGASPGDRRVQISGRLRIITEVPVLLHRVSIGDEITESDLGWVEIAEGRMSKGVVQDPRDLIGLSPRRRIQPNKPVRFRDVQKPLLIAKGKLVNMIVQTPFMRLSTTGKALDSGAYGDTVRVQNTSSRQVIQAVVDARDTVRVLTQANAVVAR
jgi:flagella basal body P-ring formation protein FlgA